MCKNTVDPIPTAYHGLRRFNQRLPSAHLGTVSSRYSSARRSSEVSSSEDAVTERMDSNRQSGLAGPLDSPDRQPEPSKLATEMNASGRAH